jgi:hypothetical protein
VANSVAESRQSFAERDPAHANTISPSISLFVVLHPPDVLQSPGAMLGPALRDKDAQESRGTCHGCMAQRTAQRESFLGNPKREF